ncbi:MAG TPA: hypothetical protein VFA18_17740 [Gemmataceae bacterium]|nr:hypothetical protein [Gemmataceae bacterium]
MSVALAAWVFFLLPLAKQAREERPAAKAPMLWVKAEDLKGLVSGDPIDTWPDARGHQHSLQAKGQARPTFRANALDTFPAVVFAGDPTSKTSQFFDVPLQGEWPGVTVLAVGSKLTGSGWLDSAPGRQGCLRTLGPLQHTGTQAVLPTPFPALKDKSAFAQVTIVCGYDNAGVLHLNTFANGVPQQSTNDADALFGVLFRKAHLGNVNNGEHVFNGELAELLIYQGRLTEAERQATERYLLAKYHLGAQDAHAPKVPIGVGSRLARAAEMIKQAEPRAKGTASRSRWAQQYPSLPHTLSWLGNSFSGKEVWVQNRVSDGCVLPDGTLATIHVWDEAGREGGLYKDGKVIGKLEGLPSAEYGHGGVAIATDGKYLYVGCSASDYRSFGIRRYTLNGKHAPWPGFKDREWNAPADHEETGRRCGPGAPSAYLAASGGS